MRRSSLGTCARHDVREQKCGARRIREEKGGEVEGEGERKRKGRRKRGGSSWRTADGGRGPNRNATQVKCACKEYARSCKKKSGKQCHGERRQRCETKGGNKGETRGDEETNNPVPLRQKKVARQKHECVNNVNF